MFKEKLKKMDTLDWILMSLTSMSLILFIINVWPAAMNLANSIHWGWFLAATVILSARPKIKAWFIR